MVNMTKKKLARVADREDDYAHLGLKPGKIEPWEDGMRTTGGPNSYEWWYFDAHLDDGTSLVITFYTKWVFSPQGPLAPMIIVDINTPGQPARSLTIHAKPEEFSSSKERCDVRIKDNYFSGDLHTYQIRVADQGLSIDVELVGQVPAWRHETGYTYFGEHDDHMFGWLPSVPQGKVTATITEKDSKPQTLTGIGYHDHNWGDVAMSKLINHWYWGRGKAGPYSLIISYLYAEKAYGQTELPLFMLAKDGKVVADDSSKVTLHLEDEFTDEKSKKPVANRVIFEYKEDDRNHYLVTFQRSETILDFVFADKLTGFKHVLALLLKVDSAYLRFSGTVSVERYIDGKMVEQSTDPGIWELMYLGHVQ
jgi:hypothetical protein